MQNNQGIVIQIITKIQTIMLTMTAEVRILES
jgi:hypothetical protein